MIIPEKRFFLFGMGHREKHVYKDGKLIRKLDNKELFTWDIANENFLYDQYKVVLTLQDGSIVTIFENENGFYVNDECLSSSPLSLPSFEAYRYPSQLKILHHEILISFNGKVPVPNIYVYDKAWYRDGAMMAFVLEKTGNLHLLKNWALSITELYDKNNSGFCEPDNLGQLAYILSLFVDKDYPLVKEIVYEANRIMENGVLTGITDFNDHSVYSTLWLKYGLSRLGVDTSFIKIPKRFDNYARMFWMDKSEVETDTCFLNEYDENYPYLWWAVKHFDDEEVDDDMLAIRYPMSWERLASQAKYEKIDVLSTEYAKNSFSAPHSWHAAEMFMYLIEKR